jgi:WD40 repeat protein
VRLNHWDGTALKEMGVLEGNKGIVSALAFSPDGNLLAAGDVGDPTLSLSFAGR